MDFSKVDIDSLGLDETPPAADSIRYAMDIDPVQYSKNKQTAIDSDVPQSIIDIDPKPFEVAAKYKNVDFDSMQHESPWTAKWLSNPENAIISQNDVPNKTLERLEYALNQTVPLGMQTAVKQASQKASDLAQSIPQGFIDAFGMTFSGAADAYDVAVRSATRGADAILPESMDKYLYASDNPGVVEQISQFLDPADALRWQGAGLQQVAKDIGVPKDRQDIATDIFSAAGQMGQQMLAAPLGAIVSLTQLFAQGVAQQAAKQRATGTLGESQTSDNALLGAGGVTAITEKMGLDSLVNRIPPNIRNDISRQLTDIALAGGVEAAQEVVEGIAQNLIEYYTTNPDAEIFEGVEHDATVAGGAGALMRSVMNLIAPGKARAIADQEQLLQYQHDMEQVKLDSLNSEANNSELRDLDPNAFKQFIESVDGDKDTHVFVDGLQAKLYLQSKSDEEIQSDPALKLLSDSLGDSAQLGTDFAIPVGDFGSTIAGTEHFDQLRDSLTMSAETVAPYRVAKDRAETESHIARIDAMAQESATIHEEEQEIYEDVKAQLIDTGLYDAKTAGIMASVVPAWATVHATGNNMSTREAYERSGLSITGPQTGELARLEGEQSFNITDGAVGGDFDSWMNSNNQSQEVRDKYAESFKTGDKFPLPYLDKASGSQDGRNRAMAAKKAGITEIPVGVIDELSIDDQIAELKTELEFAKGYAKARRLEKLELLEAQQKRLNQSPIELKPTETKEFKEWFGNSKVVDDAGKPIEVYHGAKDSGFSEFDTDGKGKTDGTGAFFTSSRSIAETYSGSRDDVARITADDVVSNPDDYYIEIEEDDGVFTVSSPNGYEYEGETAHEAVTDMINDGELDSELGSGNYSVYLSIKNPMIVDAEGANWDSIYAENEYIIQDEEGNDLDYFTNSSDAEFAASNYEEELGYYPEIVEYTNQENGLSTDDLAREAREAGYDGLIINNVVDDGPFGGGYSGESTVYVAFEPNQIKSVNNQGTFNSSDANIYKQDQANTKNLVVMHNITETGIRKADEIGGLAAPSIAVANIDKGGFDNFGEISLIPKPEMLNDPKIRTFDADIYSSRQPRPDEVLDDKKLRQFDKEVSESIEGTTLRAPYLSDVRSVSSLDNEGTQYHYLKSIGKAPKVKKTKPTATSKAVKDVPPTQQMENPKFIAAVAKKYKAMADKIAAAETNESLVKEVVGQWFHSKLPEGYTTEEVDGGYHVVDSFGEPVPRSLHENKQFAERRASVMLKKDGIIGEIDYSALLPRVLQDELITARNINEGVDMSRLREDIGKKMGQAKISKDYNAWLDSTYEDMVESKRMFTGYSPSGDRKYKPYTMANIVKEMNKKLQGGESSNYGTASVRAMYANEMKNVKAVQAKRDEFVTSAEMVEIKGEADLKFEEALEDLKEYYEYDSDSWGYASDVAEAIAEGPKGVREAFGGSPEANKIINDLGVYLGSLPSEYFEAKAQRPVQFSEFDTAVIPKGTSKDVVQLLRDNGIKIKMYDKNVEGSRNEVISKLNKLLFQDQSNTDGARGYYSPAEVMIRLTESADRSTFLHEFAHFMLEMERNTGGDRLNSINNWNKRNAEAVAKEAGEYAPEETITAENVNDYIDNGTSGNSAVDSAVDIAIHEQFARGFEVYLMEGKAPSLELRNAFRTFARWLTDVWKRIRSSMKPNVDEDMAAIYDRLLATEAQIEAAEARGRYEPMFTDATMAGMTEDEYAKYLANAEKVKDVQTETLRDKLIAQYTRTQTRWWKDELDDQILIATEELSKNRVNVARDKLKNGDVKLDLAEVKETVGVDKTDSIGRKSRRVPDQLKGMTVGGGKGLQSDIVAAGLGYESGHEMMNDIMNSPSLKDQAKEVALDAMIEIHGDVLNDGTVERLADEAVQNEDRGRMILKELKALSKGTRTPRLDTATMKSIAEDNIAKLNFRSIHPAKYRRAEIKAAQESAAALAVGDRDTAAQAKVRQVMNYYLGMAANDAKTEITSIVDHKARYNKKAVREEIMKAGSEYWEQLVKVLERFEFRKSASIKSVEQTNMGIREWVNDRAGEHGEILSISEPVLNELFVEHWKNVPLDTLRGIDDSVRSIEHVARRVNKVDLLGEKVNFDSVVSKWVDQMESATNVFIKPQRTDTVTDKPWYKTPMAQMTKIPFLASWLDGGERVGMSHELLLDEMNIANKASQEMYRDTGQVVADAIENRSKADIKRHTKTINIPEIANDIHDGNLKGHQILSVALNTGNQGNLRKMLLGEGWVTDPNDDSAITIDNPQLQAVLNHMTESDWEFVNLVWTQMEKLYEPLAEVHRKSTGVKPPQVVATEVKTPRGVLKGGYYPVVYDKHRSVNAAKNAEKNDALVDSKFGSNMSIQSSVNASATSERTGFYDAIDFNLNVIPNHFAETVHFITHHDAIRQTNKLVNDKRVRTTIISKVGIDEYSMLQPWLNDIAKNGKASPLNSWIDNLFGRLRTGVTLGVMGFKASTGIIQLSGIFNTYGELGSKHVHRAMRTVYGNGIESMRDASAFAIENSNMMGTRTETMDREIKAAMDSLQGKRGFINKAQETSMKHIALIQYWGADILSWHAGYTKELERSGDDVKAYKYADWVVENIQGSGNTKDMASLMRSQSKTHTTFTMFMTFFSSLWNNQRDFSRTMIGRGDKGEQRSVTDNAAKLGYLLVLPVLFEMLMRGEVDLDDEDLAEKALTKLALYPIASVPVVRDISSGLIGDFGYNSSPIASMLEKGIQGTKSIIDSSSSDKDVSLASVKNATKLAGAALRVPGISQAWATGEHLYDVAVEGEELTMHQLLFGPERK